MIPSKKYYNKLTIWNKIYRFIWRIFSFVLGLFPGKIGNTFFQLSLKLFGAKISPGCHIYNNCIIWSPRNLIIGSGSTIAPFVEIYNVDKVIIGRNVLISQGAWLCTASHDYRSENFELITKPLSIGDNSWIAARASVVMVERIAANTIIGACVTCTNNIFEEYTLLKNSKLVERKWR